MLSFLKVVLKQRALVYVSALFFLLFGAVGLSRGSGSQAPAYDLALAGGRVIDPATGLDAVRYLGISDGKVAAISRTALQGKQVLDVKGLVVAPGFIDLHFSKGIVHVLVGGTFVVRNEELVNGVFAGKPVRAQSRR